jgi:hypothetical protein
MFIPCNFIHRTSLLACCCFLISIKLLHAQSNSDAVIKVNPAFLGFYSKYLDCDGIPIRSSDVVDDKALYLASGKLKTMLSQAGAVKANLKRAGAELHIIGKNQQTSDLPEWADLKGVKYVDNGIVTDIDKRTRGFGTLYASCGEENLLKLSNDRYAGSDICVHEFSHTLMEYGLDDLIRGKIRIQYDKAVKAGLWKGAYAATNPQEYWAELSMWYFGSHGDFLIGTQTPSPGQESLSKYDRSGYLLLDSIYRGLLQPASKVGSGPVLKGAKSGSSTQKSTLRVTNNRDKMVKLYFIDQQGTPKLHDSIPAKTNRSYPSYYTHVWMLSSEIDKTLYYFRINDPEADIRLENDAVPSAAEQELLNKAAHTNVSDISTLKALLSITNNTVEDIKVFWVDWSGNRTLYAVIKPNERTILNSFVSHVWLITNRYDKVIGDTRIKTQSHDVAVTNKGLILK